LGGSISTGIMTSAPYTNVKGGSLVEDYAVVWYDHRIPGRCSSQLSLLEFILLFRAFNITLFADSGCPFA
ncbi:hypothetical protein A2U01_0060115, partial [Trifolium medium]|nr:hypothetical protein [Trifolium medium]